jgi:hypothetical protein
MELNFAYNLYSTTKVKLWKEISIAHTNFEYMCIKIQVQIVYLIKYKLLGFSRQQMSHWFH